MRDISISNDIIYIGADDKDIELFENQYDVPNGVSYNSYIIIDKKIAIMDTIDKRKTSQWLKNLEKVLNGRNPDYLVISHLEPDHAYNIDTLIKKYPNIKLVGNSKTFTFLPQFFEIQDLDSRKIEVKEGDILDLGNHKLKFIMAPMVHWPEVMMTYEEKEKTLFSADAFGKFGTLDTIEDWDCEARRYYFNIVGKYGMQVQTLLKKVMNLDIEKICPLHGPILKENLEHYIEKYNIKDVVIGSIFTNYISEETVHFSNKNELFYTKNSDEDMIISELSKITNVYKRSSEVMYKYNVSNHIEKVKNEVAKLLEGDNSGHGL